MARDAIDALLDKWARIRRELLGIRHPLTAAEYLGSPRCTLAARRDLHEGATSKGRVEQKWPEFPYREDMAVVNLAVKSSSPTLQEIFDWHWVLEVPRDKRKRADLMGVSANEYWKRVARAKERVAGAISVVESVRTHSENPYVIRPESAEVRGK